MIGAHYTTIQPALIHITQNDSTLMIFPFILEAIVKVASHDVDSDDKVNVIDDSDNDELQ